MQAPAQLFSSMWLPTLLAFLLAALLGWMLSGQLRRLGLLDQPNARSAHKHSTPRGGGLAFIAAALLVLPLVDAAGLATASSIQVGLGVLLIPIPLALVGLLDDRLGMPVGMRLIVQLLTAAGLVVVAGLPLPLALVALLPGVAVINAINFMDGLDGLVAGCMAVLFSVAAITGMPALWPLVGALLGFLLWNWSPAKVFMGDVGSTFLGAVFAGVVLQQVSFQSALGLLLVGTPLLADACLCVPRRLLAGQRVFQAHRLHLFQRLHQAGWSHTRVSSLFIAGTAVLALALLWGGLPWLITLAAIELLLGIWLDQRVAVPFAVASRS